MSPTTISQTPVAQYLWFLTEITWSFNFTMYLGFQPVLDYIVR